MTYITRVTETLLWYLAAANHGRSSHHLTGGGVILAGRWVAALGERRRLTGLASVHRVGVKGTRGSEGAATVVTVTFAAALRRDDTDVLSVHVRTSTRITLADLGGLDILGGAVVQAPGLSFFV